MKKMAFAAAAVVAAGFLAPAASAATFRTAVSVSGVDTNPCTPAAPCRTISYALTQTSPGGEMFILSSGGYGPFTVTQAVTITAPSGIIAAVSAPSGNAITVTAGLTDLVILNGFLLDGLAGSGTNGVQVNSAGSVSIGESSITGFSGQGINFVPNVGTGSATLIVSSSTIFSNTAGSVMFAPVGGTAGQNVGRAFFRATGFVTSPAVFDATNALGPVSAQIHDSRIRNNPGNGIVAIAPNQSVPVQIQIDNSNIYSVSSAFTTSGPGATITLGSSSLTKVSTVVTTSGGAVLSYGNNEMSFYTTLGPMGARALQ